MTVVIMSSTEDPASTNIKNNLLNLSQWNQTHTFSKNPVYTHNEMKNVLLVTITDKLIHHNHIDEEITQQLKIQPKQIIFISRHTSQTGAPTLTVHPVGNYSDAQFGGKPKTLG